MERILSRSLGDILVGANTGGFKSFRRKLFVLVGDEMAAVGELVDRGTLTAQIEDTNLMIEQEGASLSDFWKRDLQARERTLGSGTPRLYRDLG